MPRKSVTKRKTKKVQKKASTAVGAKTAAVLAALRGPQGATLQELMGATSWQSHSVRGFLSGTVRKKMGLEIARLDRADRERAYRIGVNTSPRSRTTAA